MKTGVRSEVSGSGDFSSAESDHAYHSTESNGPASAGHGAADEAV